MRETRKRGKKPASPRGTGGTRIVVMSGYAPDPDASSLLMARGARFLPKPFLLEQLLGVLRDA
jgi:CheY-like chemotaxis protein